MVSRMPRRLSLLPALIIALIFLLGFSLLPGTSAYDTGNSSASLAHAVKCTMYTCDNAGWGIIGKNGSVTGAFSEFTVPNIMCGSRETLLFVLVQIDGQNGAPDLAYAGFSAECYHGSLYTFASYGVIYSSGNYTFGNVLWKARPGDKITMSISASQGLYAFSVKDARLKISDYNFASTGGAYLNSMYCGSSGGSAGANTEGPGLGSLRPLAQFTRTSFKSCEATVNGKTRPVGDFSPGLLTEFVLYNLKETKVLARPGALINAESGFEVKYVRGGP